MADETPERRYSANVERQRDVGRMAMRLAPGGAWPAVLDECDMLRPSSFLKAPGVPQLIEADFDASQLQGEPNLALGRTITAVSGVADRLAAAPGGAPRSLPALQSAEFEAQFCEAAHEMFPVAKKALDAGYDAAMGVKTRAEKAAMEEEAILKDGRKECPLRPACTKVAWDHSKGGRDIKLSKTFRTSVDVRHACGIHGDRKNRGKQLRRQGKY
jgi:hypothetical protein